MTDVPTGLVKIVNCKFDMPLKLSVNKDEIGDRKAWAQDPSINISNDKRFLWSLIKTYNETDGDCYYIVNEEYKQPLKLGLSIDIEGDRKAWGGYDTNLEHAKERKYYWKLIPVGYSGRHLLYKILNSGFNGYLKLSLLKESDRDRAVLGDCVGLPTIGEIAQDGYPEAVFRQDNGSLYLWYFVE